MKRIKSVNGYTIYQATARDVERHNVEEGYFYLYFSSDIRAYGLAYSYIEFEAGSLEEAEALANGSNYAAAQEYVETRTTAATFDEIEAVEKLMDSGMTADEIAAAEEEEAEETETNNTEEENIMKYVMYPKIYTYTEGHHYEETRSATQAMQWHREGKRVTVWGVNPEDESQYHVSIRGAAQPARTAEDENRSHCKHIAQELDAYVNGEAYRCPDCGEILHLPDDVGDRYRCPHCETVNDVDDLEQLGIWDFLTDVFDVEYRCGSDREYRSVRVMVACGGPNIYLDSASKDVELYWWNERSRYPMSYEAAEALDQWAEDYWNM